MAKFSKLFSQFTAKRSAIREFDLSNDFKLQAVRMFRPFEPTRSGATRGGQSWKSNFGQKSPIFSAIIASDRVQFFPQIKNRFEPDNCSAQCFRRPRVRTRESAKSHRETRKCEISIVSGVSRGYARAKSVRVLEQIVARNESFNFYSKHFQLERQTTRARRFKLNNLTIRVHFRCSRKMSRRAVFWHKRRIVENAFCCRPAQTGRRYCDSFKSYGKNSKIPT